MAQVAIDNGAFPGDPTAVTVYSAFGTVNANAVTIDAEQVVQDGLISDNAAQISVIDGQITGLGVGLNDVNAQVNINTIDIAANTAQIALQANMTYAVLTLAVPYTNVTASYSTLFSLTDGDVEAHQNYEYKLSAVISSTQLGDWYYIRTRIDNGAWTEMQFKSNDFVDVAGSSVVTLWFADKPLTNSSTFEVEIKKDAAAAGSFTVSQASVAIVQMDN